MTTHPVSQTTTRPVSGPTDGPPAMSESRALHVAMAALSTHHHPQARDADDRAHLAAAAPEALAVLARLQRRLEQEDTAPHLARCAVCGALIVTMPQYAFGVDEETGQFHRVDDLAVCTACVNVLRAPALANARKKGWTRTGE